VTPKIMTVLGPIPADKMGTTLMHEHLFIDLCRVTRDPDHWLNDFDLTIKELAPFLAAGGATVVEVTNRDLGRDPVSLKRVASETGLNVVMGCGWYREPYYRPEIYEKATEQVAEDIVREIEQGVNNTGICPGIIGEIGCDRNYVSPAEERSFRAAARAQKSTDLTITTHAVRCPVGLDQLDVLEDEGVDFRRVIVGHCDTYPHPSYHETVAQRGAYVQFDTIRSKLIGRSNPEFNGFCCMKSHLHAYGGNGYDYIFRDFVPRLLRAGLSKEQVQTLLVENPRDALTGTRS
jgi:predicted metal-dependent phosphotriesterase family hydrolase